MQNRTMIIIWSWASKGVGEGEWSVAGKSGAVDRVVCRDLRAGPQCVEALRALIDTCQQEGRVMVFLHRQHGYHAQHLEALLASDRGNKALHCFLFGEGADPIYLTREARGLLGASGTFSARVVENGQEVMRTAVADPAARTLKPNHFDFVWQRYESALYLRLMELREDLFSALGQEPEAATVFAPGQLYQLLSQDRHRQLLLRLLSLAGRIREKSDLAREIRNRERADLRTLTFEGGQAQLASMGQKEAADAYRRLSEYILRHVLSKGEAVALPQFRDKFEELLRLLQEE